jgi:hypothetical protein
VTLSPDQGAFDVCSASDGVTKVDIAFPFIAPAHPRLASLSKAKACFILFFYPTYRAFPVLADRNFRPELNLREVFEQYHSETSKGLT